MEIPKVPVQEELVQTVPEAERFVDEKPSVPASETEVPVITHDSETAATSDRLEEQTVTLTQEDLQTPGVEKTHLVTQAIASEEPTELKLTDEVKVCSIVSIS